jgi:hypothetical protein
VCGTAFVCALCVGRLLKQSEISYTDVIRWNSSRLLCYMFIERSDAGWDLPPCVECELKLSCVWNWVLLFVYVLEMLWSGAWYFCGVVSGICYLVYTCQIPSCFLRVCLSNIRRVWFLWLRCLCGHTGEYCTVRLQWVFSLCCRRFKKQHSRGNWIDQGSPRWPYLIVQEEASTNGRFQRYFFVR